MISIYFSLTTFFIEAFQGVSSSAQGIALNILSQTFLGNSINLSENVKALKTSDIGLSSKSELSRKTDSQEVKTFLQKIQCSGFSIERVEGEDQFVLPDITFSDIQKLTEEFSFYQNPKLGTFSYCPEKKSICFTPGPSFKIEYPNSDQWMSLKKSKGLRNSEEASFLLTSGSRYLESTFIKHPLFKNSIERHSVFCRLSKLLEKSTLLDQVLGTNFERKYHSFLRNIKSSNLHWADPYKGNPMDLAYIALYAYLNGEIDQEELFTAQMVASAFAESPESAAYLVLTEENAKKELRENNYFDDSHLSQDFDFLKNLNQKPLLKRTQVSYVLAEEGELSYTDLKKYKRRPLGFQEEGTTVKMTLIPTWLLERIYEKTLLAGPIPPKTNTEYFGYDQSVKALMKGRPISYASPLFYMPPVHGSITNQTAITAHDLLAHCSFDWSCPYTEGLIKLGKKLWEDTRFDKNLSLLTLDRPVEPLFENSVENLCNFIKNGPFSLIEDDGLEDEFFKLLKESFSPEALDEMCDYFKRDLGIYFSKRFVEFMSS